MPRDAKERVRLATSQQSMYPCPCCGYLSFSEPPGSYEICDICNWEDDVSQLRFPETGGGANHVSLLDAQRNFRVFGASDRTCLPRTRRPRPDDERDLSWRPIDPSVDDLERPRSGVDYGTSYPSDSSFLYYWRETYWRKNRK